MLPKATMIVARMLLAFNLGRRVIEAWASSARVFSTCKASICNSWMTRHARMATKLSYVPHLESHPANYLKQSSVQNEHWA